MPVGLAGLFLAALFGAAMSMLASDLNCLAVITTQDFYVQFFPRRTDRQRLRFAKSAIAVCGLLAIGVALRLATTKGSALALYYTVMAIVAGGLAGLFLLAFLVKKAGKAAAVMGIAVNLCFTTWAILTMNGGQTLNLYRWNYPWHEYTIGAIGNILLFVAGLIASHLIPAKALGPSRLTLCSWLAMRRQARQAFIQAGEPG
jgi:SSS family solute:Na+ symporter